MSLGKGLWDDPETVAGTIVPAGLGFDLGTPNMPFRNAYLSGSAIVPAVDLQNDTYLKSYASNGTTLLDLLKADAGSNTVLNALTGKKTSLTVNHAEIANLALAGLTFALGKTALFTSGSNGKVGTFTANGVTGVTVSNTSITANSIILIGLKTVGGTVGAIPSVKTITPGTGFTVSGTASDTSVYYYVVLENV